MAKPSCMGVARQHALDWIIAFALFAAGGIVQTFKPNPRRFVVDESISLPVVDDQLVPSLVLLTTSLPLPVVAFLAVAYFNKELKVSHYLRELHHVFLGYLTGLGGQILLQGFGTIYVGNLRPDYLAKCVPDMSKFTPCYPNSTLLCGDTANVDDFCTSDADMDSEQRSFFSGHASLSMFCFLYYGLYMAGRLKAFHDVPIKLWKLAFCFLPVFGSLLIGWSRVTDNKHRPWEVFFGFVDGAVFALVVYPMYFHWIAGPKAGIPRQYSGFPIEEPPKEYKAVQGVVKDTVV